MAIVLGGDFETGKTYFAATMPDPIIILDMDQGTEALWEQYDRLTDEVYPGNFSEKDIRVLEIRIDEDLDDSGLDDEREWEFQTTLVNALASLEDHLGNLLTALKNGARIGSVVFETASWLWMSCMDYMKYEVLKLDPTANKYVNQMWDWDKANKKYIIIYKQIMGLTRFGCHVLITVHTKPIYKEYMEKGKKVMKPSGDEDFHWYKKSSRMSPLILHVKNTTIVDGDPASAREARITDFIRLRGVPNAVRLAQPIEDITWDKLIQELHDIRKRHADGGIVPSKKVKVERRNRRQRGRKEKNEATEEKPAT